MTCKNESDGDCKIKAYCNPLLHSTACYGKTWRFQDWTVEWIVLIPFKLIAALQKCWEFISGTGTVVFKDCCVCYMGAYRDS